MAFVGGMVANWFQRLVFNAESPGSSLNSDSLCIGTLTK